MQTNRLRSGRSHRARSDGREAKGKGRRNANGWRLYQITNQGTQSRKTLSYTNAIEVFIYFSVKQWSKIILMDWGGVTLLEIPLFPRADRREGYSARTESLQRILFDSIRHSQKLLSFNKSAFSKETALPHLVPSIQTCIFKGWVPPWKGPVRHSR